MHEHLRALMIIIILFLIATFIGFTYHFEIAIFFSGMLFSVIVEYAYRGMKYEIEYKN